MKIDLFENKYKPGKVAKIIFMDIICFLLAVSLSVSVCYAYFSAKVNVKGAATFASLDIEYRKVAGNPSTSTNVLYGSINGGSLQNITATTTITPGDEITIGGYAVNISNVPIYVLGRLEVVTNKDTEVVWYNIETGHMLTFYKGLAQVGASVIPAGQSYELNLNYTLDGYKYTHDYTIKDIKFSLYAHQKDNLSNSEEYINYQSANGYTKESIFATHCITNRKRFTYTWVMKMIDEGRYTGYESINTLHRDSSGAYLINNGIDYLIFANNCNYSNNYCSGKTIKLNCYLDFEYSDIEKTIPYFYGNFDGNGYTMSNFMSWSGVFHIVLGGSISNLGMEGVVLRDMSSESIFRETPCVGPIAGAVACGKVENCYVVDAFVLEDISEVGILNDYSGASVGGLVGCITGDYYEGDASIKNCWSFSVIGSTTKANLGGLVGLVGAYTQIDNSYFLGICVLETMAGSTCGGIVGSHVLVDGAGGTYNTVSINNCIGMSTADFPFTYDGVLSGAPCNINNSWILVFDVSFESYHIINHTGDDGEYDISMDTRHMTEVELYSMSKIRDDLGWDTGVWVPCTAYEDRYLFKQRVFYNF